MSIKERIKKSFLNTSINLLSIKKGASTQTVKFPCKNYTKNKKNKQQNKQTGKFYQKE